VGVFAQIWKDIIILMKETKIKLLIKKDIDI
jgi:hypothetical protein